jgi:hypothetical protein
MVSKACAGFFLGPLAIQLFHHWHFLLSFIRPTSQLNMFSHICTWSTGRFSSPHRHSLGRYHQVTLLVVKLSSHVLCQQVIFSSSLYLFRVPDAVLFYSLPCLLCGNCLVDTCIPESVMLRDPRRLYAPGRLYHIVDRKPFRYMIFPALPKRSAHPVIQLLYKYCLLFVKTRITLFSEIEKRITMWSSLPETWRITSEQV